jgi:hypothetical protein
MTSIEWYTQILEQDKKQLSINETLNFYHRENFFKMYSLKIFVPLSKVTSFDAVRRALSMIYLKSGLPKRILTYEFENL